MPASGFQHVREVDGAERGVRGAGAVCSCALGRAVNLVVGCNAAQASH